MKELLKNENSDYNILRGNFNIVMDQEMDIYNINDPQARKALLEIVSEHELSDI